MWKKWNVKLQWLENCWVNSWLVIQFILLLYSKVKSLKRHKSNLFFLQKYVRKHNCNHIRWLHIDHLPDCFVLKTHVPCLDQINAKRMVNTAVRIFHFLGRKAKIWLKVTFADRTKQNLGLKYFLQVNLAEGFKNQATAVRGEPNWEWAGNCWLGRNWNNTEEILPFLLFGEKGNLNDLKLKVVA